MPREGKLPDLNRKGQERGGKDLGVTPWRGEIIKLGFVLCVCEREKKRSNESL